jgi:hypothetical protein
MLCKVTLGVLKGASKLNVLLLLLYEVKLFSITSLVKQTRKSICQKSFLFYKTFV